MHQTNFFRKTEKRQVELAVHEPYVRKKRFISKYTFTFQSKFLDLKRDPVRLHDYYKKQWEKFRLPGDDSHETKELRWAVREWMMGRKPPES